MRKVMLLIFTCGQLYTIPGFSQASVSPVSYTVQGQIYTQLFDGLPNTGTFTLAGKGPFNFDNGPFNIPALSGWQFMMPRGTNTNAGFIVSTGSLTSNGVQSLGTAGAVDRALGSLSTGSAIYAIGVVFSNNTGITLNSITLSFTAEQWRKGGTGNKNTWSFHYNTGSFTNINTADLLDEPHFNFSSIITTTGAGSLNGNLPENRQTISYTLTGITWKPGEQLLLRWDDADETGSDDACAIDDLHFSAEQVEDLPAVINKPISINNNYTVQFNYIVNDNNAATDMIIEYDTVNTFLSAKTLLPQPDHLVPGTGSTAVTGSSAVLKPGTLYYYRLKATNRNGTTTGAVVEFTSPAIPDRTPPLIYKVTIPDKPMKTGDTIPVTILIKPESSLCKVLNSTINGFILLSPTKKNDSTYTAYFVISNGGKDMMAKDVIPVSIMFSDSIGNSAVYTEPIIQDNDAVDANRPFIKRLQNMQRNLYKANDTLLLVTEVSETTYVSVTNGTPSIRFTIGNTSRTAFYLSGSGTDSLVFMYIIQTTDEDTSGFKLSSSITLNSSMIRDDAGNSLSLNLPSYITNRTRIDGISPKINNVTVPAGKYYKANDTLVFTVNFTEKIMIGLITDTIRLKITIGSSVKDLYCYEGNGTQALQFRHIVQKNDLDKTGITLGALTTTAANTITDTAGNPCVLTIKNAGSLSNVKVDAVAPSFTVPVFSDVFACRHDSTVSLNDALMIADDEKGDSLTLRVSALHNPYAFSQNTFTLLSNGSKQSAGKISYALSQTVIDIDTIVATISDGINEAQKMIRVIIHPEITNNNILPTPYACSGTSVTITGTEPSGGNGNYEYLWEYTNTSDTLGFIKTTGLNSLKDLGNSPKLSSTIFFRRRVTSGACSDITAPIKIIPLKTGIWFGDFTNEWTNPNNWCNTIVPGPNTDVYISPHPKNDPVINDTASCHDITMAKNATLIVNGNLQLSGNINDAWGSIDLTKGKFTAAGTILQKIPAGILKERTIRDLIVNNPAGVILSDTLFLTGVLQLVRGNLETGNRLLIRSSGSIGQSADGISIKGDISFERSIAGKKGFRLLGHPFSTDIILGSRKDSIFYYDPLTAKDSLPTANNWTAFQDPWKRYSGIRLTVGYPSNSDTLLKFSGSVNTGEQEIILHKGDSTGYHLIANPYASIIDLSLLSHGSGVGENFWIWDIGQGDDGGYSAVPFQSKYLLPPFGAFFVKATGVVNNTILFTENCKTTTMAMDELPVISNFPDHHIELRLKRESAFLDRILIYHSDSAWIGIDKYDAEKFMNTGTNFYSLSREKKLLSIDVRPLKNTSVINLGLQNVKPGSYTIQISACRLSSENTLQLHDKYMNRWMALDKDSSYSFTVTEDTATRGDNRFEISTRPEPIDTRIYSRQILMRVGPVPANNEIILYYTMPEGGNASIRIIDQYGSMQRSIMIDAKTSGEINVPVNTLLPGLYFVEMKSGKYMGSQKFIKL